MSGNYTPGAYLAIGSPIHKLDPRSKMTLACVYILLVFSLSTEPSIAILAAFLIALIFTSRIPLAMFRQGMKSFLIIIILTALLQMFMTKGNPLFTWHSISISHEGLEAAILLAIRLLLIIIMARWLLMTTSYLELIGGLERILLPLKRIGLPVSELIMIMGIALRFIPLLEEEALVIRQAQMARGADWQHAHGLKKIRLWLALLVPLLMAAFQRAEELAQSMEARGFSPGEPRTGLNELKMKGIDYLIVWVSLLSIPIAYFFS